MQIHSKKILQLFLRLFLILFFLVVAFLVYIAVNDYQPPNEKRLNVLGPTEEKLPDTNVFSVMSWNIGYAGLGSEMDFFYDGGEKVRPEKKLYEKYLNEILDQLEQSEGIDFIFLQEVDVRSKRSYLKDQTEMISGVFNKHYEVFAKNYDVSVVPVPLFNSLGKVEAGMMTFSKFKPSEALRIAYPNLAAWPKKLFLLDRACIALHIPLPKTEKELILLNTHNSFYIKEDSLRQKELDILRDYALKEYKKGNYVLAGGDWNQNPPGLQQPDFLTADKFQPTHIQLKASFMPSGWQWVYDPTIPTNREVDRPYTRGETTATIIDFFLASPNIEILERKAVDLNFVAADHQPVYVKFKVDTY